MSNDSSDDGRRRTPEQRGANPRRPTQAQSIKRQQEIVADRDGAGISFTEIARKHGMGEKEVREAYRRYIEEIAPLMTASAPAAKVGLYLRELESVRHQLHRIAEHADNDSAKVGALREIVKTISKEVELQQHLGMLPKNLGEISVHWEQRWVVQQIVSVLERFDAPPEAFRELEQALSAGDSGKADG
jgi:hypothetical protein